MPVSLKKKKDIDLNRLYVRRILVLLLPSGIFLMMAITTLLLALLPFSEWQQVAAPVIGLQLLWLFAVSLLINARFIRNLTRPIAALAANMRKVDPANVKMATLPIPPGHQDDEIGQLARATNHMLRRLHQSIENEHINQAELTARETLLDEIVNSMSDGVVCLGPDYRILRINRPAQHMLQRSDDELLKADFVKFLSSPDQSRLITRLTQLAREDEPGVRFDLDASAVINGKEIRLNMTISRLFGEFRGFVISFRDPNDTRQAKDQIKESEKRLQLALRATNCGVWEHNLQAATFWWSPEFATLLGYDMSELPPTLINKEKVIHPEDLEWVRNMRERYLKKDVAEYSPEYRVRKKDGSVIWIEERATAEWDENGKPLRINGTIIDCSERKRFESQMMYMATHDPLTGLPNRTLLNDRLQHALTGNQRLGLMVGVLLLDIDRFKLINDSLGHEIGDQLIRSVAQRLQQNIRPTDTLARLSGDEFVVICEGLATPQEAARVAKRLLSCMAQHYNLDGNQLNIGMSVGISISSAEANQSADLLRHADIAMHSAKSAGGNCYRYFAAEMNKEAIQRLTIERQISEAIERQQFVLHYQPKVDINTLEIIGMEALIRWPQLNGTMISPLQFIPVAEETGQVLAIGEWVLREALSQICLWRDRGMRLYPIAVNLSAKQLMSGGADELILRLLREYNVPANLLEIEITESALMTRMDKVMVILQRLREHGVGIALDDFGTGYSSLAYLRELPITSLKIDRSFVRELQTSMEARSITNIILQIGHELGMKVVAEGVETQDQLNFLREKGCDIGQGWLFHKPLSARKLQEILLERDKAVT